MADSGIFKTSHQVWQRANIMAAANYLREQLSHSPEDLRLKSLYEGLLEVLDPSRRTVRVQRELASVSAASRVERRLRDRRMHGDRRLNHGGPPDGIERRSGIDRRSGRDRRRR
ncbi:MAG TPA: hypothetical protein VK886_12355 [Vicinamibacterales bacterium]|nr:hypothetical protein [Vicinamibacterales bacterium]